MPELHIHSTPQEFLDAAEKFLLERELENNLILGIVLNLPEKNVPLKNGIFVTLSDENGIFAACVSTLGRAVVSCTRNETDCAGILTDYLARCGIPINGAFGETEMVGTLVHRMGLQLEPTRKMMAHQLETISPLTLAGGSLHTATEKDLELVIHWHQAFQQDTHSFPQRTQEELREVDLPKILNHNFVIWKDGNGLPVSMAAIVRELPHTGIVGFVFTPPEYRGHGYARSCVLKLSEIIQQRGKKYCALFTDVSNPVSNHIYYQIGYRPVSTFSDYQFG